MIDIEWDDVDSLTFGHSFGRLSSSTTENLCPFNHVARAQINGSRVTKNIFECTPSFGHSQQSTTVVVFKWSTCSPSLTIRIRIPLSLQFRFCDKAA